MMSIDYTVLHGHLIDKASVLQQKELEYNGVLVARLIQFCEPH